MIFLEVLDRRGRVTSRHRIDRLPATIGRAYGNEVILDDPFVCPRHLRLVRAGDGQVIAEDLDSVNGTYRDPGGERVASVALGADERLRLGQTVVRVRDRETAVAPTLSRRPGARGDPALARSGVAIACLVGLPAFVAYMALFERYERLRPSSLLALYTLVLVCAVSWAGVWSLVSRLVGHEWRFLGHLAAVCAFLAVSLPLDLAETYVGFLTVGSWPVFVLGFAVSVVSIGWLLALHLGLLGTLDARARAVIAGTTSFALVGLLTLLATWGQAQFGDAIRFDASLAPFPQVWIPGGPPETFVAEVEGLEAEVRELARRR